MLHIEGIVYPTQANGPGKRILVAVRGCSLQCPGCVNKHLWDRTLGGRYVDPAKFVDELLKTTGLSREDATNVGLTISGAEPLDQAAALFILLVQAALTFRDIIVFSGYTIEEIEEDALKSSCLAWLDAIITNRYLREQHATQGLKGSANQEIIVNPYRNKLTLQELEDFEHVVEIHPIGVITGFPSKEEEEACQHS